MQHNENSITDSSSSIPLYLSNRDAMLGQYYMASFEDLYGRKCRRCLYSDYYLVDLRALPVVIHILIGIIPVHVLFAFILPLVLKSVLLFHHSFAPYPKLELIYASLFVDEIAYSMTGSV